jgi:serine/threonine protein kinase/Tfp pilus assembly protein PilF
MIGKTVSHYKILERIGGGGMGVVYKAEDTKLKRPVALKFLPPAFATDPTTKERFIQEAQAASSLQHNNICAIHEIDETKSAPGEPGDGQMFIVMDYYEGETLKFKIEKESFNNVGAGSHARPISDKEWINQVIDYTIQIAQGLQEAHQNGIIHRDIKPANIMVTDKGEVKILDFGLAKLPKGTILTKEKSTLGTTNYMSPEIIEGRAVDHRTDIWSLGILFYELVTGQLPFKGEYESAVIYSILNDTQEPVTGLRTGVPIDLETIIDKCLNKHPSDRYQHIDDLIVDLKRLKESLPLKSGQIKSTTLHASRRSVLILSSIVVSILACITILYFVFFQTAEEESPQSERKMIVVLPFKNLGPPEDEYFCDGITEEITSRISEIKQLGVIGRTSADRYKNTDKSIDQIGAELNVDYLLEGSVRWEKVSGSESRIRVTPQLIKVSDGTHLWTKRYDAILESVFEVQSDIAEKVANALNITLLGVEQESISQKPTDNLEAYDYYLRGNLYHKQSTALENISVAEHLFLKAIEIDSNFVLAYTRLAQINVDYYWFYWDRTEHRLRKSKYYIDKALKINPDLPEIYLALGHYYYQGFLDYDRALNELEKGLKIKPSDGEILSYIGFVKRRQGRFEESITDLKKSLELDPLNESLNFHIGETFLLTKDYEMAEKYLDKAISAMPDLGLPYAYKAKVHIFRNGNIEAALEILSNNLSVVNRRKWMVIQLLAQVQIFDGRYHEALRTLSGESPEVFESQWEFLPKAQLLGIIYGLQKNEYLEVAYYDSARIVIESELLNLPDDARLHSALGIVFAGLGQKEEAVKEGKFAVKLLPVNKEAWRGFHRELDLAKIYAMVGEYDLAIDKLEYLLAIPGELSVPYIRLDPVWRPLLSIPRFQKLLEQYN